jgi:hypothetical protein
VERLRKGTAYFWPDTSITDFSSLMSEAASRISTLERELEEARAEPPVTDIKELAARMQQTLDHAQATGPNPTSQRALEYRLAQAINALASTPSPAPAESGAVAWYWWHNPLDQAPSWWWGEKRPDHAPARAKPLYDHPAPSASMGRVTVKALEWEAYGGRWRASSPGITVLKYIVNPDKAGGFYVSVNGQPLTSKYATTDAAKAAAQSHFAAAIFAALDSPPIKAGEAVPARSADREGGE